jgi:hypothetical protein
VREKIGGWVVVVVVHVIYPDITLFQPIKQKPRICVSLYGRDESDRTVDNRLGGAIRVIFLIGWKEQSAERICREFSRKDVGKLIVPVSRIFFLRMFFPVGRFAVGINYEHGKLISLP